MQTKKMSLANIQGKLSRAEMKNIMAGSGSGCVKTGDYCNRNDTCCSSTAGYFGKCPSQELAKCQAYLKITK